MNLKSESFASQEKSETLSPDMVREVMSAMLTIEDEKTWIKAKNLTEGARAALKDIFEISELEQSLYWHAFSMGSPKRDVKESDDADQRLIAKKIKEYVADYFLPMIGGENKPTYTSVLLNDIDNFRSKIADNPALSVFFQEQLQKIVSEVQQEFPGYSVRKIPELDRAIGGGETNLPDIPEAKLGEIVSTFAQKYKQIQADFNNETSGH